jgi:hypothetical protein
MAEKTDESRFRNLTERFFGFVEDGLYVLIAAALAIGGAILFGYEVYSFATHLTEGDLSTLILDLLDGLLLVFIITEIIHTIRVVIDEKILVSEPFLVVGVVAAIRRLVVVSAEAKDLLGTPDFGDAMLEIGILTGAIALLGLTIFLLRHTDKSEPRPAHEPG